MKGFRANFIRFLEYYDAPVLFLGKLWLAVKLWLKNQLG